MCEVDDGIEDKAALLPFVQKHLSELRRVQAVHRKELRQAEAQHPTNLMTQQEMAQLTTDLYLGKITLDVNSYRAALQKLSQHSASEKDALAAAQVIHIKNVQAAQNQMQLSDVVFASPATGGLAVPEGIHWLAAAVQEANKNRRRVSVLAQDRGGGSDQHLVLADAWYDVAKVASPSVQLGPDAVRHARPHFVDVSANSEVGVQGNTDDDRLGGHWRQLDGGRWRQASRAIYNALR